MWLMLWLLNLSLLSFSRAHFVSNMPSVVFLAASCASNSDIITVGIYIHVYILYWKNSYTTIEVQN